jgi:hypothetical protein
MGKVRKEVQPNLKIGIVLLKGHKCSQCQFCATSQKLLHQHLIETHNQNRTTSSTVEKIPNLTAMKKELPLQKRKTTRKEKEKCLVTRRAKVIVLGYNCSKCHFWATSRKYLDDHISMH